MQTMKLNILLVFVALLNAATGIESTDDLMSPHSVVTEPVDLGIVGNYVILTKTNISNITSDIAVSPIAATVITGFGLVLDSGGYISTASQIMGKAYAVDCTAPTPSVLTTTVSDIETGYADASQRFNADATRTNIGIGDISGDQLLHL
jgi:hypothetical protein